MTSDTFHNLIMIPSEEEVRSAAEEIKVADTALLTMQRQIHQTEMLVAASKINEFNPTSLIDIPTATANPKSLPNNPQQQHFNTNTAAVILGVYGNINDLLCTHPSVHLYLEPPMVAPLLTTTQSQIFSLPALVAGQCGSLNLTIQRDYDMQCWMVERRKEHKQAKKRKKKKADRSYCCYAPAMFIISVSFLQIGVFFYDYITVARAAAASSELSTSSVSSASSVLIYRPDRRFQIWRYVSYMMLHVNWLHLSFNVVVQLLYGLPLEMGHGSLRIAVIYLAGVIAGALGTSVVDSEVFLVGASGGVYALLAAQLANILVNFEQMRFAVLQLMAVFVFVVCSFGYALYSKYFVLDNKSMTPVSYVAHMTGSLAGFTLGLAVLKHFDKRLESTFLRWFAFSIYAGFHFFAIAFNLLNTVKGQALEEEGEVFKEHLFHDLGISE